MKNLYINSDKERGQSMVELAVTITFLMMLLAGTIDLGRAFFTWLALRDAAQEGASYGSFKPSDITGIQNRVWDNLEQVVNNPASHISVIVNAPSPCAGNMIQVDVNYPTFPITMPFLGTVLGTQIIPIHATINDSILAPLCP
jgi:hypothetical protein